MIAKILLVFPSMYKILFIVMLGFSSLAQAQKKLCFQNEIDPRTGRTFFSENEHQDLRAAWLDKSPGITNPFSLMKAYAIYKNEKAYAQSLGSDKLSHCYLGCRISQATNYQTADYVGWLKEDRDLTDCKANSQFDEEDYIATIKGAQFGETQSEPATCARACLQIYK